MDPLRAIAETYGFFTRSEAKEAGYADRQITQMVRRRHWVRIRRGAYVFADRWAELDSVGRHRVRSSAVLRSLGSAVALSHVSGLVRHDIEVWGVPLDRVHVTRLDGGPGRVEGDVVHHEGFWDDSDVLEVSGERVLTPERCVLEAASRVSEEAALCLLDSGLRAGSFDHDTLVKAYLTLEHWPFMHRVAPLVPLADGRSGSIGESRGRRLFRASGIPAPQLQVEVRRTDGTVAGVADWGWPAHGVLGEFDGRVKYGRLLRPGQDPGDVVFEEKRREDELRELTGCRMIRLVWSDYDHPRWTSERVRRALRLAG
jgi:hypothetical protein